MEEDIEILEEFIEQYNASYPEEKEWVVIYPNQIKAIENLIARYKDLEVEIFAYKNNLADYTRKVVNEVFGNEYISKLKVKGILEQYKCTEIGDAEKLIEFYKKLQQLLDKELIEENKNHIPYID